MEETNITGDKLTYLNIDDIIHKTQKVRLSCDYDMFICLACEIKRLSIKLEKLEKSVTKHKFK